MIDNLIRFSIKNKLIIGLFTIALVIWGAYSVTRLPIDAVPDITNNQVQVITTTPTLAALEVEQFITYPIEIAMSNVPGVTEIRSISRFGLSVVTVVFKDEVDIYLARQLVGERIKAAQEQIPPGLGTPEMAPISTGLGEIYQYVLDVKPGYENKYNIMDLRTFQDWIVKRQLAGTPGVTEVSSFGGLLKQYEVSVNPERLRSFNLTFSDIFNALEKNNQNTGGSYIEKGHNSYFIRGIGLVGSLEDIEKIVIKNNEGVPVLIRDVATVQYGNAVRYGALTRNGKGEAVGGIVLMLKGENSNEVIENVKEKIEVIQKSLPEGVVVKPFIDRSALVDRAIGTVEKNLIEGGLIVIFVLVLFLGNFRAGLVVASVIPLAMLFAISMMNLFGVSGNLMSLGAIDFGLIVDGAVIIVEAIVHRITTDKNLSGIQKLSRDQMDEEVYIASTKIRKSAAFGEIIILIVYLPILALVGIEGKMFKPMAQTVSFAILGALILSLTYVPMASALFLSRKTSHKRNISDKIMDALQRLYDPIIRGSLRKRVVIILSSIGLFIISLLIFLRMGGEFIPTLEEGDLAATAVLPPGSSLSQTIETAGKMEAILLKEFPEVKEVVSKIGAAEIPTDPMPVEAADITIMMKDKEEWTTADNREEMIEKMEKALEAVPGVNFEFSQPIQLRFNELMTGVRSDIAIKIYGEDLDVLYAKANEAAAMITPIEGVSDMRVEQVKGLPQIMVTYNRDKIAQYGLAIEDINEVLRTAFAGNVTGVVFEGEKRFDMVVRLAKEFRQDIDNIENLFIPLLNGSQIPLKEVASIEYKEGPMQVSRERTKRRITIGINVRERDVESLVEEIQKTLNQKLQLPPGYYVTYGGQFENLIEAKARLSVAVPVALALILMLLFFTFGSFKQTLLIFTAIPMAAIGGVFSLLLRDMPFSISAGVGFIALFGVAVLNGIVLIGYFNQLKKEGMDDVYERILLGTKVRLRPVIMTAAVASLGFLPMALSNTAGAEVQKPLATVVIGGLITSTLLTLVVLPILYSYMEKMKPFRKSSSGSALSIILIVGFLSVPFLSKGQDLVPAQMFTANDAVNTAIANNPSVAAATLGVEQQKTLKRASFDLAKTNVGFSYGQYNSLANDNAVSVSQSFAFPGVYTSSANLARQQIKSAEFRAAQTKNELSRNVRLVYYLLLITEETRELYLYQDSLYSNFKKAADIRFETGETAYLEKLAAETRMLEVQNALFQINSDLSIYKNQLVKLLNTKEEFTIADSLKYNFEIPSMGDTSQLIQNPYLSYLKQQIAISEAQAKLERARLLPDFNLGLTSQTLKGNYTVNGTQEYFGGDKRFEYLQAGIGIPLWFGAQRARVKAAKIGQQVAAANYEFEKIQLESEFQRLVQQYLKYQNVLRYYETSALKQSDRIIEFSQKSIELGEISYVEYIQNITQALQIKVDYLNAINEYNQTIINLEFILGGQ